MRVESSADVLCCYTHFWVCHPSHDEHHKTDTTLNALSSLNTLLLSKLGRYTQPFQTRMGSPCFLCNVALPNEYSITCVFAQTISDRSMVKQRYKVEFSSLSIPGSDNESSLHTNQTDLEVPSIPPKFVLGSCNRRRVSSIDFRPLGFFSV